MTDPVPWLVLLPFGCATLAFMLGPGRGAWLAIGATAIQLLLVLQLAGAAAAGRVRAHAVGGWEAPLGIGLRADGLAVVMLLLAQAVGLGILVYARAYFRCHGEGSRYFWPLAGILLAALNALFLSADVFNIYVTLELVGLSAVALTASTGDKAALAAALRYLFATLLGSGAYLFGVALLYGTYGTLSIGGLGLAVAQETPATVPIAALLMLAGLTIKTALFPFHFWLPPAHGGAPAPVSAMLSALVLKASFYLIVRLWFDVFHPIATPLAAQVLGVLGAAAILWGSLMALRQERLKMLIAYSTVAQVGYLFLLFPLFQGAGSPEAAQSAYSGAVMQVVAHGLAKAAMFAAAGTVILSIGHDCIAQLGGISSRRPLGLFSFGLAGITLMGLPPSSGFIAKWLLIDGAIRSGQWYWTVVMIAGGLLAAAYVFKVLRHAFLRSEQSVEFRPLPATLEWAALALALASLALGFHAGPLLALVGER